MLNKHDYTTNLSRFAVKRLVVATSLAVTSVVAVNTVAFSTLVPEGCSLFGINDKGLNTSQFVKVGELSVDKLSRMYPGADIEGLDISAGGDMYGSAGDNVEAPYKAGHLYKVDKSTGAITPIGDIRFNVGGKLISGKEVSAISFRPTDDTLWGWVEECGLVKIDKNTATAELMLSNADVPGLAEGFAKYCTGDGDPTEYTSFVEDLTWDTTGRTLYFSATDGNDVASMGGKSTLFAYTPNATPKLVNGNFVKDKSGKIIMESTLVELAKLNSNVEAVETLPDDRLLINVHGDPGFKVLDPYTGSIEDAVVNPGLYGDIEGFTWYCPSPGPCADWTYIKDAVGDGTGTSVILGPDGNVTTTATGVPFETYGAAVKQDGDTISVAISTDMSLKGDTDPRYPTQILDNNIAWSDFVFDIDGKKYAVHFSGGNDSGVTTLGLYKDVTLKSVTKDNYGWGSLGSYANYFNSTLQQQLLGDLGVKTVNNIKGFFDQNNVPYLPFNAILSGSHVVPMSVASGTRVEDDNFRLLYAAELKNMGLDFAKGLALSKVGLHTFGFTFKLPKEISDVLATGKVLKMVAYTFTECTNDGIAIVRQLPLQCGKSNLPEPPPPPQPALTSETIKLAIPGDNKNSAYNVTFVKRETTLAGYVWTYQVSKAAGRDLSHWSLGIGSCFSHITNATAGVELGKDGSTNGFVGAKWNKSSGTFTITLDADYPAAKVDVLVKAGGGSTATVPYAIGQIIGPVCN